MNLCKLGLNQLFHVFDTAIIVFIDHENMGIDTKIRLLRVSGLEI